MTRHLYYLKRRVTTPWTPAQLPGLQLWLDAGQLALADGDPVAAWTDSSSLRHDAVQPNPGAQPVYRTTVANGRDGSLTIHQDAEVSLASLAAGERVTHELAPGRHAWLQVLRGSAQLNGVPLATSDGAAVSDESSLTVLATEPCEIMLFDLP